MTTAELSRVESECIRLNVDFAAAIDQRDYPRVLELFAEDGVLRPPGTRCAGHAQIRTFLEARPAHLETRHMCTNFRIRPQPDDTAIGTCYVVCYKGPAAGPDGAPPKTPAPIVAEYHDRYVHTPSGWKIQERVINIVSQP